MLNSKTLFRIIIVFILFSSAMARAVDAISPPPLYVDTKAGIIFFVESDQRHLAAVSLRKEKVLWDVDVIAELHAGNYKRPSRIIVVDKMDDVKWAERDFIHVSLSSGEFMSINKFNGIIEVLGKD